MCSGRQRQLCLAIQRPSVSRAEVREEHGTAVMVCVRLSPQVLGALFTVDDITGFEITKLIELPEPYGIIALWGLVFPLLFIFANTITNLVFRDALIMKVRPILCVLCALVPPCR